MSPRAFSVGGVRVEVEASVAAGPAGGLFSGFASSTAGGFARSMAGGLAASTAGGFAASNSGGFAPSTGGGADILVCAAPSRRGAPEEAPWRPSFFHGAVRAFVSGGAFLVRDGASAATVSGDGRRIEVLGEAPASGVPELALLLALVVALRHHGVFHLHAAALEEPGGRRVLVAGTSGAGKTTLALALAAAGFSPLCDDAVFLTGRGGARAVGLPRPFHLGERTAAAFPALAPHLGPAGPSGKRFLEARAALGAPWRAEMALPDTVLLPEIARSPRSALEPIPPLETFGALLDCGALAAADGMPALAEHLSLLRAVADGARAARVRLGEDVLRDPPGCARALLGALGEGVPAP